MGRNAWSAAVLLLGLLAAGCNAREVAGESAAAGDGGCTRCHGGAETDGGAPPHAITPGSTVAVGAHTAHVTGTSRLAPALGCDACHPSPDPANPRAHIDGAVTVRFGALGSAGGITPAWDRAAATCTVYCHGASLAGGGDPAPGWNLVDGSQDDCGSCHGVPPPAPHPQNGDCARCHPGSIVPGATLAAATALHLNGQVDLAGGCATCHGDANRVTSVELVKAAPPASIDGETATTARGVGAHQAHVQAGDVAQAIACETCHVMPAEASHSDGVVQLRFTGVANANGVTSALTETDPANPTCTTWCHGAQLSGAASPAPIWTKVDGTQAACGACHGAPPPAPHPSGTRCSVCHPGTVDATGAIRVANGMHVNGALDVSRFHPSGWLARTSHGYAANEGLAGCKACHGADFGGGDTGISCNDCHASVGHAAWQTECTFCHGEPNRATNPAAPPVGTAGELATTARAVGAHEAHLVAGQVRAAMACAECHAVPTDLSHVNGTPALAFGPLARTAGATPAITGAGTCSSTYCHGATLAAGGTVPAPLWTKVDGTQAACGACHGNPPPSPHPQVEATTSCEACHPDTMAGGSIDLAGGKHVDGHVDLLRHPEGFAAPTEHGLAANRDLASCKACHGADLAGGASGRSCDSCHTGGSAWRTNCSFCHGDAARAGTALVKAAPPQGTQNEVGTTVRGVGAHQRHLTGGAVSNAFACAECHAVPADLAHVNGTRALAFGATANADGVASAFTAGSTCTTYCHGATLAGGDRTAPVWTTVDGTQADCGSCHGLPPATIAGGTQPHSPNPNCASCHEGYTVSSVNKALHVNGRVDVKDFTCSSCHGDPARAGAAALLSAAPPAGTAGETAPTERAVGAHQRHLSGGSLSRPIACAECHVVPGSMTHSDVTVQLAFGALARTGGAVPAWNRTANTCASTYCHGATLSAGGTRLTPVWTGGAAETACGACHGTAPGFPAPPAPHPANPNCGGCHEGYTSSSVNLATHVDGDLDLRPFTCSSCHGDSARSGTDLVKATPPSGTAGETSESQLAVGAHAAHVYAPTLTNGYGCEQCHVVPPGTDVGPPALHADGTVAMAWGTIATGGGTTAPAWDRGAATCSASYCHGTFDGGQLTNAPGWTLGSSQATCGSCHGAPPPAPHVRNPSCGNCHPSYPAGGVNRDVHANGSVELLPLTCASCHGDPARPGTTSQKAAPPLSTGGVSATTDRGVGAHAKHVYGSGIVAPLACSECHVEPTTMTHPDGAVSLTFGPRSQLDGATPSFNTATLGCSSTYCHGATLGIGGGSATTPVWTAVTSGATPCGSCHGAPPPDPHPANPQCGRCHDGYGESTTNLATHMNGTVDVKPMTCTSCHGDEARAGDATLKAAPPAGTAGETATTARAVGAHQKHLLGGGLSRPIACTECHAVPTSMSHPDGPVQLAWGTLATANGATASFDGAAATCTNYCHGSTKTTGTNHNPAWTGGASQAACGTCHFDPSAPPPGIHSTHSRLGCSGGNGQCHPDGGYTKTTVNLTIHIDGVKQAYGNCEACHYE